MSDARDLSGVWHGIFNYPRSLPPTNFVAKLVEHGGALAGETEEVDPQGQPLTALIHGDRNGSAVRFIKSYDDRHTHAVHYTGALDPDGNEITGTWRIPGNWSGTFVMVRPAGAAEAAERKTDAAVGRSRSPAKAGVQGSGRSAFDSVLLLVQEHSPSPTPARPSEAAAARPIRRGLRP